MSPHRIPCTKIFNYTETTKILFLLILGHVEISISALVFKYKHCSKSTKYKLPSELKVQFDIFLLNKPFSVKLQLTDWRPATSLLDKQ